MTLDEMMVRGAIKQIRIVGTWDRGLKGWTFTFLWSSIEGGNCEGIGIGKVKSWWEQLNWSEGKSGNDMELEKNSYGKLNNYQWERKMGMIEILNSPLSEPLGVAKPCNMTRPKGLKLPRQEHTVRLWKKKNLQYLSLSSN